LKVTTVNVEDLARGSSAQWAIVGTGQLKVVVQNANINGDGTLVTVKCKALNTTGSSTLVIQVLEPPVATLARMLAPRSQKAVTQQQTIPLRLQ